MWRQALRAFRETTLPPTSLAYSNARAMLRSELHSDVQPILPHSFRALDNSGPAGLSASLAHRFRLDRDLQAERMPPAAALPADAVLLIADAICVLQRSCNILISRENKKGTSSEPPTSERGGVRASVGLQCVVPREDATPMASWLAASAALSWGLKNATIGGAPLSPPARRLFLPGSLLLAQYRLECRVTQNRAASGRRLLHATAAWAAGGGETAGGERVDDDDDPIPESVTHSHVDVGVAASPVEAACLSQAIMEALFDDPSWTVDRFVLPELGANEVARIARYCDPARSVLRHLLTLGGRTSAAPWSALPASPIGGAAASAAFLSRRRLIASVALNNLTLASAERLMQTALRGEVVWAAESQGGRTSLLPRPHIATSDWVSAIKVYDYFSSSPLWQRATEPPCSDPRGSKAQVDAVVARRVLALAPMWRGVATPGVTVDPRMPPSLAMDAFALRHKINRTWSAVDEGNPINSVAMSGFRLVRGYAEDTARTMMMTIPLIGTTSPTIAERGERSGVERNSNPHYGDAVVPVVLNADACEEAPPLITLGPEALPVACTAGASAYVKLFAKWARNCQWRAAWEVLRVNTEGRCGHGNNPQRESALWPPVGPRLCGVVSIGVFASLLDRGVPWSRSLMAFASTRSHYGCYGSASWNASMRSADADAESRLPLRLLNAIMGASRHDDDGSITTTAAAALRLPGGAKGASASQEEQKTLARLVYAQFSAASLVDDHVERGHGRAGSGERLNASGPSRPDAIVSSPWRDEPYRSIAHLLMQVESPQVTKAHAEAFA